MTTSQINAEIVAIGTEILLGEITDTNSVFIARTLRDIGLNLYFMTSVGDNQNRIAEAIRIALGRAEVVITCGGLGPTVDDMTRQGVADAVGRSLVFHPDLLDMIAARFTSFRVQMTENNRRQAYLPEAALVIENPVGTAPGFIVEHEGRVVISLPGVPREMKFLMTERVIPYLREKFSLGSNIIKARVLRTAGIGESLLDAKIGSDLLEMDNPTVGLAAHTGQVDVRITAKASSETEADIMIGEIEARLRERIGDFVFGVDTDRIQDVLVQTLREHALHVAISETGIGPSISQMFASAEQGSQVVRTTQNFAHIDDLRRELNAPPEVEIRELAEQIASALCQQAKADAAIAVVSRLDSETDRADQDGGTAIAVYMPGLPPRSRVYGFGGLNDVAQSWASTWSLSMLWRMLKETNHGA